MTPCVTFVEKTPKTTGLNNSRMPSTIRKTPTANANDRDGGAASMISPPLCRRTPATWRQTAPEDTRCDECVEYGHDPIWGLVQNRRHECPLRLVIGANAHQCHRLDDLQAALEAPAEQR